MKGATSAQADMNHFTSFHYIVAGNNIEILDLVLSLDRPAALSIINNLGTSRAYASYFDSPLTTAIGKGQTEIVKKLLQLGAGATTPFEHWIKTYLAKNPYAGRYNPEHNMAEYRRNAPQPIILAAVKESGPIVENLLAHGADANSLVRYCRKCKRLEYENIANSEFRRIQLLGQKLNILNAVISLENRYLILFAKR